MTKIQRKPLSNTLKKDMKERLNKKAELADKVVEKLQGREVIEQVKKAEQSKLTVMIPKSHHEKLKFKALEKKKKIRELIIEFIDSL